MLPDGAVSEFKDIYLKRFGIKLSDVEAKEAAYKLLSLFREVYKPIPGEGGTTVNIRQE